MKNLVVIFVILFFASCDTTNKKNGTLLEHPFNGQADYTSAVYNCYSFEYRPADSLELLAWAHNKKDLPDRVYTLSYSYEIQTETKQIIFLNKDGVIKKEAIEESNKWLINKGKIKFLAIKNSSVITEFHAEKDPASNFMVK
jgi:hypothetical protein